MQDRDSFSWQMMLAQCYTHARMHARMHTRTLKAPVNLFSLKPPGFTLTGSAQLALLPALRPKRGGGTRCLLLALLLPFTNTHSPRKK